MSFIAVLLVACIISSVSVTPASIAAASHTHSVDNCFAKSKHVHTGNKNTYGGCYTKSATITCGSGYYDSQYNDSYSTGTNSGQTDYYGICSGCGQRFKISSYGGGPSGSWGSIPLTGILYNHTYSGYTTACGYDTTTLHSVEYHVHTGTSSSQGGCYQGGYTSIPCSNTSSDISVGWTYVRTNGNQYATCGKCGGTYGPGTVGVYSCNTCGYEYGVYGSYSLCGCYGGWASGNSVGSHSNSGYALSCGKESGKYYDVNMNIVTPLCNKVVTILSPNK